MKILKLSSQNKKKTLNQTRLRLKRGQVVICPTDTVYGLICDAQNKKAVAKIYQIKKRPRRKLLPIFVNNLGMAKKLYYINSRQERFLKKHWPGALTVVLEKDKPAFRMPNYKFVLNLVKHVGPLAESSANLSGKPASTKIKEVLKQFENRKHQPNLAIDAGNLKPAKPSRVVDLTVWPPKTLRR